MALSVTEPTKSSRIFLAASICVLLTASCADRTASTGFFGKVAPPSGQVLRYITGPEPESLDPQLSTGQPEARIYMALYEGLIEFHPVTLQPIPAVAERWEVNRDSSEFIFHLRRDARWSNGEAITAHDFVYSLRRGLSPELAARSAHMAYYVKNARGYNQRGAFVRDPRTQNFLPAEGADAAGREHLIVPLDEKKRAAEIALRPALRELLAGKELIPVRAEDVGIEAVDDHTLRITLTQPAPFFVGLMGHQFFKAVPRAAIEQHGLRWTRPENIVTSGPFRLESWEPYHEIVVAKNPHYWDAANVRLEKIHFYPSDELTTMMNLYKAGDVDAVFNHTVPTGWIDSFRRLQDYMDAPEAVVTYMMVNTARAPMDDVRVRRAFNLAIDKRALAAYQRSVKPLYAFTPEGIFEGYPQPAGEQFDPERAKQLLVEAGYHDGNGRYDSRDFPAHEVEYTYNTLERNREVAEFVQAQWKQNLGITVNLKSMEGRTFLAHRSRREYKGFARGGWSSDYMDPISFLNIFSAPTGDNGTNWWDARYVALLDAANRSPDAQERYRLLARAEAFLLEAQPVIPLFTSATNFLKKPYVKGLYPNPMTLHAWKFVYIEPDPARWDRGLPPAEVTALSRANR